MGKLNYDLGDIVNDPLFYQSLIRCGDLTKTDYESSMAVNGTEKKYTITKPLKEDRRRALSGGYGGLTFEKKGYGLYLPKNANRILTIHFHPPGDLPIPSNSDLYGNAFDFLKNDSGNFTLETNIIGHKGRNKITCFIYQINPTKIHFSYVNIDSLYDQIDSDLRKYCEGENDDGKIIEFVKNAYNKDGSFFVNSFSFGTEKEYFERNNIFKKYDIVHKLEDVDIDLATDDKIEFLKKEREFDELDDEFFKEEYGIFPDVDDNFFRRLDDL